jgi:hypothetical protein
MDNQFMQMVRRKRIIYRMEENGFIMSDDNIKLAHDLDEFYYKKYSNTLPYYVNIYKLLKLIEKNKGDRQVLVKLLNHPMT